MKYEDIFASISVIFVTLGVVLIFGGLAMGTENNYLGAKAWSIALITMGATSFVAGILWFLYARYVEARERERRHAEGSRI